MKIKNNKGLTLIELIIAVALITIVLGIGYKVFDKIQILPSKQASNSDIQNGMNRVRDLTSKELKYCESVELEYKEENNKVVQNIEITKENTQEEVNNKKEFILKEINKKDNFKYQYNIIKEYKNKSIKSQYERDREQSSYIINVYTKKGKKYFSVSKIDYSGITLDLIDKQEFDVDKLPMNISYKDKIYSVRINYIYDKSNYYTFDVYNNSIDLDSNGVSRSNNNQVANGYLLYCIEEANRNLKEAIDNIYIENNYPNLIEAKRELDNILINKETSIEMLSNIDSLIQKDIEKITNGHSKQAIKYTVKAKIYINIAMLVINHINNDYDHINNIHNDIDKINQNLDIYQNYLYGLFFRYNDVRVVYIPSIQFQILGIKDDIVGLKSSSSKSDINKIIDKVVNVQIRTIELFKNIDNIGKNDEEKIKSLMNDIDLILELKCDLGDVNYL